MFLKPNSSSYQKTVSRVTNPIYNHTWLDFRDMEGRKGKEMDQQSREKRNPTDEGVHTVKSDLIYQQTLHWRAFMISLLLLTPAATEQEYFLMIKAKIPFSKNAFSRTTTSWHHWSSWALLSKQGSLQHGFAFLRMQNWMCSSAIVKQCSEYWLAILLQQLASLTTSPCIKLREWTYILHNSTGR